MLIEAHHLTYTKPSNHPKPHFSILMAHFSYEIEANFESSIPHWPDEDIEGQISLKQTSNYNDLRSLQSCIDCNLIIIVVNNLTDAELQQVDSLLILIKPQHAVLLSKNSTLQLQNISTYIACDFNLIKAIFVLAWTASRMVAEQLVGADYADFIEYVLSHNQGVMHIADQNTQANNFVSLAAEAIEKITVDSVKAQLIATVYASTVAQLKGSFFLLQHYYDIRKLYQSTLEAHDICASHCIVIPCDEQTNMHQTYPYVQIAMFANAEQTN